MRLSRKSRQWAFVAALAALLAGCAQPIPKYVSQASGPRAELVMRGHACRARLTACTCSRTR